MKVKSKVWIEKDGKPIFGEGKARLFQAIEKTGSINEAAQLMGISFRRAWGYITAMEKRARFVFVNKNRGGKGGGGSRLTEEAKRFLRRYERLNKSIRAFSDKKFKEIWK
ncbi:MAG: LysR family transcriptional regulator [Candidatus Omnitrophica bacterium]|nr:LysR family transcriptional regulator [Candidatus Omnitrophota bacterium]